ncbi:MAG TPA: efflux RND transporter periplasmic adaptor subunit [Bacteroidales bacterium]|nr:efflux RND transporter periplasmic adaptor subunit [Bacteroidales bacterium]
MYKTIIIIILAFLISCQNTENKEPESVTPERGRQHQGGHRRGFRGNNPDRVTLKIEYRGDTIFVPSGSPVSKKLELLTIKSQDYNAQFVTTGVVKPLSGHLAHVTTPFDGRVVKSFVRLGEKVRAGTPLFEVNSTDYLETVRTCIQARQQMELAEKNFLRKKELLESGVTSRKDYDEAKMEFELAEKECEKTKSILEIYNLNPQDADMAKPLIVRSPIAGEIVQTDIIVGQYIKSDAEPIVTVADLEKIWVIARVKEKDLGTINLKDRAEVITESFPDKPIKGIVNYIGNIMDEQTRSVEVYLECDNQERILKPGMFVTIRFYRELDNAIVIPSSALLQDEESSYIFMRIAPDLYLKKSIYAETIGERTVIVRSGLNEGDNIISEGAIYLR